MACSDTCQRPTPSQAHCGACHATFGSVSAFDRHRQGPVDHRSCALPASVGLVERAGIWRAPAPQEWPARGSQLAV